MRPPRDGTPSSRSGTPTGRRSRTTSEVGHTLTGTGRALRALPCPPDATLLDVWAAPLAAALDGSGPALVPIPEGPTGGGVAEMARVGEPLESDEIALVVPTSGSTGVPKGALLTAEALRASGRAT